jgi:AhpD family alkylhydroperoxidase
MHKDFAAITKRLSGNLRTLREDIPDTLKAFSALSQAATRSGALDRKTKELIALALGVAAHCDGCIGYHAEALVKLVLRARKLKKSLLWRSTWVAAHP